jgi:hypothetical protein
MCVLIAQLIETFQYLKSNIGCWLNHCNSMLRCPMLLATQTFARSSTSEVTKFMFSSSQRWIPLFMAMNGEKGMSKPWDFEIPRVDIKLIILNTVI